MKGEAQVIERLNEALFLELGAVNQYWVHYRLLADWGVGKLASKERAESIEEMHHADKLIERVLFLEGLPNLQALNKLIIGENVPECLAGDLTLEQGAHADTKAAITYCESVHDYVSHEILEDILEDTEEHIDYLETQLELIAKVGVQNYLQSAMGASPSS